MTKDWTEPLGSEYPEPPEETKRFAWPRWLAAALFAIAYIAVMVLLAVILIYSARADARAERANLATCKLASVVSDQASVLDAGIGALRSGPSDIANRARLDKSLATLERSNARAEKACRDARK